MLTPKLTQDTYYDLGGNFIDTANVYQFGQSEQWIGEWMEKTGRRSEMVLSTKYTLNPVMASQFNKATLVGPVPKARTCRLILA